MNIVDPRDQMRKKYLCGRVNKKYWKYLMMFIIDCACTIAYIVFREDSPKELDERECVLENSVSVGCE